MKNGMTIEHLARHRVFNSARFDTLKSYDDLVKACKEYAKDNGHEPSDEDETGESPYAKAYNERVGEAFEVFSEFFLRVIGGETKTQVCELRHTSDDKYNVGFDYEAQDRRGRPKLLQMKFRSKPNTKFSRKDLGTFVSVGYSRDIKRGNLILFTNLDHKHSDDSAGVFCNSYRDGLKDITVYDRKMQESYIRLSPYFWQEFANALAESCAPKRVVATPTMRPHQVDMHTTLMAAVNAYSGTE